LKTEKNILIAFVLNLAFSIFEFVGGALTGSVAIVSDAVHDMGDAVSIGASWLLERKSKKQPDEVYTYGYRRFSVMGSLITTVILLVGSGLVIYNAVERIITPVEINYNGMIVFAVIGTLVNLIAAFVTREGESINQRAVNLHMLEDVLGWLAVLAGAVVMRFTDVALIDPILSICVSLFIFVNAFKNLKQIENIFLEKIPDNVNIDELKEHLCKIEGVEEVHHIHIRSIDGSNHYASMHIVTDRAGHGIKDEIREELREHHICHATLELESPGEHCHSRHCHTEFEREGGHHHHHH